MRELGWCVAGGAVETEVNRIIIGRHCEGRRPWQSCPYVCCTNIEALNCKFNCEIAASTELLTGNRRINA